MLSKAQRSLTWVSTNEVIRKYEARCGNSVIGYVIDYGANSAESSGWRYYITGVRVRSLTNHAYDSTHKLGMPLELAKAAVENAWVFWLIDAGFIKSAWDD